MRKSAALGGTNYAAGWPGNALIPRETLASQDSSSAELERAGFSDRQSYGVRRYDEMEQAENYMVRHFPSFFLALNEAERVPFARHAKRMFRYFVIYHKRLGESQRAYEARRRSGNFDYDSDEQEFISGIDEHLTRATDDLHKVTEYLLTKP